MTCNNCNECNPCDKEKKPCCELKVLAWDCVDVEEVDGQYVISATCPPRVLPWEWIHVDAKPSTEEWYSTDYTVHATDNKVWVCSDDDNPSTLDEKLRVESPITRRVVGCGSSDWYMLIWLDTDKLEFPDEKVAVRNWCDADYLENLIEVESEFVELVTEWCKLKIKDKARTFYDNNVCLWFDGLQDHSVLINEVGDTIEPRFVRWNFYTGNKDLATKDWILIKNSWYYRIFWQLTVQCNITWQNWFLNLWRWLLRITNNTWISRPVLQKAYLSTAKHWAYGKQVLLQGGAWIKVDKDGIISTTGTKQNCVPEWGWCITFEPSEFNPGNGYQNEWSTFSWPWMTFNMDAYVDLMAWDLITVWARFQSDQPESANQFGHFQFVWLWDPSTEYQSLFWWSCIWVQMITPKTFNWQDVVNRI